MATGDAAEAAQHDALWRFSLAFYATPGVDRSLIALQDEGGLDVNLMLFALWLGMSGRGRLGRDVLAPAEREIDALRAGVVEPLRALRRRLRDSPDSDVQCLRDKIKALELDAEKLIQMRLARLAGPVPSGLSPDTRLADAYGNFAFYIGSERADGAEAAAIREAFGRFVRQG